MQASIHIITQKEKLACREFRCNSEQLPQIIKLTVYITDDSQGRLKTQYGWLQRYQLARLHT